MPIMTFGLGTRLPFILKSYKLLPFYSLFLIRICCTEGEILKEPLNQSENFVSFWFDSFHSFRCKIVTRFIHQDSVFLLYRRINPVQPVIHAAPYTGWPGQIRWRLGLHSSQYLCTGPFRSSFINSWFLNSFFHKFNYGLYCIFSFTIQKHFMFGFFKPDNLLLIFWCWNAFK